MVKTTVIGEELGGIIYNFNVYKAVVPTDNYVICFPGVGECNTSTTAIEGLDWYPKYAGNGTLEADFNIIAVQPTTTSGLMSAPAYGVINYLTATYGIKNLVTVGLSGGGTAVYNSTYRDSCDNLRGIVVFGGTITSVSSTNIPANKTIPMAKDVPAYIYHHTGNSIATLANATGYVSAVNGGVRNFPWTVTQFTSSTANEWVGKMNANKTLPAYQFIMSRFTDTSCATCKAQGKADAIAAMRAFLTSYEG